MMDQADELDEILVDFLSSWLLVRMAWARAMGRMKRKLQGRTDVSWIIIRFPSLSESAMNDIVIVLKVRLILFGD
jgi:hypothetical protein